MDLLQGFWSIDPNIRKFLTDELLNLNDILPKIGDLRIVLLPLGEYDLEYILWQSPYAEINGWCNKPQEIISSYVVKCDLEIIGNNQLDDELIQRASLTKNHREYQAKVIDIFPLIEFCKSGENASEMYIPYIGQMDGTSKLPWIESQGIYKAELPGNCIWLSGGAHEISVGMIIEMRADGMYAIYNQVYSCIDDIVATVNYKLEGYEKEFFTSAIKNAKIVIDE